LLNITSLKGQLIKLFALSGRSIPLAYSPRALPQGFDELGFQPENQKHRKPLMLQFLKIALKGQLTTAKWQRLW
jgi:hypothetical protein